VRDLPWCLNNVKGDSVCNSRRGSGVINMFVVVVEEEVMTKCR